MEGWVDFAKLTKFIVPLAQSHVELEEDDEQDSLSDVCEERPEQGQAPGRPQPEPVTKKPKRDEPAWEVREERRPGCVYFDEPATLGSPPQSRPRRRTAAVQVADVGKLLLAVDKMTEPDAARQAALGKAPSNKLPTVKVDVGTLVQALRQGGADEAQSLLLTRIVP